MKKTIGLTYDLKEDWQLNADDPKDANAEFDTPKTVESIERALAACGYTVKRIGNVNHLLSDIDRLNVDIVFNIAEGLRGRNRESQVPLLLEMKGIPYVGADALTMGITLDKVVAKKCFVAEKIPTPRFFVARDSQDLKELDAVRFPLIVKPRFEGSSKGLSCDSRVENLENLKQQIDLINQKYKQPALVEEFIKGTEFTIAVMGNQKPYALPVVQVAIEGKTKLGNDFYTFSRLLQPDLVEYICPADIPKELSGRLKEIAVRVYQCVDCRDFGRVDFRVDEQNNPYVLEINPLPCLSVEDVFFQTAKAMGISYNEMINEILYHGLERYGINNGKYKEAK